MGWVRLDDGFFRHSKTVELSAPAKLLFLGSLCYSAEQMTDGVLTPAAAKTVARLVGVPYNAHRELVKHGLWHDRGADFEVHDYLDYQPSAEKERKRRDGTKRRVQQFRANKRWSNADGNGSCNGVTNAVGTHAPDPPPEAVDSSSLTVSVPNRPTSDEWPKVVWEAIDALAHLDLEHTTSRVADPEAWLGTARSRRIERHAPKLRELDLAAFTASSLVQLLEAKPDPPQAARRDYDREPVRCARCDGNRQIEEEWGVVPCPDCNRGAL